MPAYLRLALLSAALTPATLALPFNPASYFASYSYFHYSTYAPASTSVAAPSTKSATPLPVTTTTSSTSTSRTSSSSPTSHTTSTTPVVITSSSSSTSATPKTTTLTTTSTTHTPVTTTLVTTTASSSTTTTTPVPTPSPSGKRGLAYNDASLANEFSAYSSKVSWAYNWASSTTSLDSCFNYVPMLWGTGSGSTSSWASDVASALASGSTHLLAFNEPDLSSQSNLSPADAATGYMTYMQPYASKAKLGSPAVTNGGSPMGLTWLGDFITACSACTIDFVVIHWYDTSSNIQYFKDHVTDANTQTGKPVWITEFGFTDSPTESQIISFFQEVLPWLDQQGFVERYSYFMDNDALLLSDGSPSTSGTQANVYATL